MKTWVNRFLNVILAILMYWLYAGNLDLSREAIDVFTWCLNQNPDCYRQWVSSFWLLFWLIFICSFESSSFFFVHASPIFFCFFLYPGPNVSWLSGSKCACSEKAFWWMEGALCQNPWSWASKRCFKEFPAEGKQSSLLSSQKRFSFLVEVDSHLSF